MRHESTCDPESGAVGDSRDVQIRDQIPERVDMKDTCGHPTGGFRVHGQRSAQLHARAGIGGGAPGDPSGQKLSASTGGAPSGTGGLAHIPPSTAPESAEGDEKPSPQQLEALEILADLATLAS